MGIKTTITTSDGRKIKVSDCRNGTGKKMPKSIVKKEERFQQSVQSSEVVEKSISKISERKA